MTSRSCLALRVCFSCVWHCLLQEGNGDAITLLDARPSNERACELARASTEAMKELEEGSWESRWFSESGAPITEAAARRAVMAARFVAPAWSMIRGELNTKKIARAFKNPEENGESAFNGEMAAFVKKGTQEYKW